MCPKCNSCNIMFIQFLDHEELVPKYYCQSCKTYLDYIVNPDCNADCDNCIKQTNKLEK